MTKLSREDVLKLAQLARLQLSEEEVSLYQAEISSILQYVEQLQTVNLTNVKPTYQVTGLTNITRNDTVITQPTQAELLKNVPAREGAYIKVKRMLT